MTAGRSAVAATGLAIVALLALLALAAPLVLPGSPTAIASSAALRAPTVVEPFGMDDLGRSVLSRVIHGYRVSLGVALASVAMAVLLGLPLGLLAGYVEGAIDQLIMRPLDILMAFPAILLAIALTSVFGTGVLLVSLALAVVYVPIVARVVRAAVLATKAEVYVEGARAVGATARAAGSAGQRWRSGKRSLRYSQIASESQTTTSPSIRVGTRPEGEYRASCSFVWG